MESKTVQNMPIDSVSCRWQPREQFDEEPLLGLAQTIKETGILQPLLVRREGSAFVIVEGERRLRAAKMTGLDTIPVIIDDRELSEAEAVYRQLVLNCSRENWQPIETARAIALLMKTSQWPASQVAVKLGMAPGTISKLLALLNLPESIQKQVASGSLPLTTAYAISRASDPESQRQLAEQAANGGLRRDEVARRAKARKPSRRAATRQCKRNGNNRILIPLGGGRSLAVAGPNLTLPAIVEGLQDLLTRIRGLERQDMGLADAVKALSEQAA